MENNYFECLKNENSENSIESMLEYCLKIFLENYTLWEKKF